MREAMALFEESNF